MNKIQRYADHPLNAEIEQLYARKNELENTLAENWEDLKRNYPGILLRSVFKKVGVGPTIIKAFLNVSRIQEVIGKFTLKGLSWVGSFVNKWFDKVAAE